MDSNLTHVRRAALDLAEPLLRGRTVFLTGSAAASERMTRFLADAGARVASIDLEINIEDTRDRFAVFERVLGQPTEKLRATLDSEDPMGAALVYAGSFTGVADVCGRRVIGARSRQHLDAERKDKQRELLCLGGEVIRLADGLAHLSLPAVVQGIPDDGVAMATSHTYLVPRSADENRV
ncbi:MAG TPA: hypothetical protein VGS19_38730, partial [Streptosporangiaceae bacterium]|nr:hypothetical protein [Streptosporangiaceae bacterium]